MAQKKITDLQLRSNFDANCNIPTDDASQTWRVTGSQMKDYMKAQIAPLATLGDLVAGNTGGTPAVVAGNTSTTPAILTQTGNGSASALPAWRAFKAPTVQILSGSGTYTPPAGPAPLYLRVRMVGPGGGGAGSGVQNSWGSAGGQAATDTTFTTYLTAQKGGAGTAAGNAVPSFGGLGGSTTVTATTGLTIVNALDGGTGGDSVISNNAAVFQYPRPGEGGVSFFGGAAFSATSGAAGRAGKYGSGGSGAGGPTSGVGSNQYGGGGGGAGGYIEAIISGALLNTIIASGAAYNVPAGGNGGSAGTSGYAGGAGGAGRIVVEEFYQ